MLARWLLIIGRCYDNNGCDASGGSLSELKTWLRQSSLHSVIKRRSSVRKSLGFENTLYVLSVILSLAFVSLVILSLAITPLGRTSLSRPHRARPFVSGSSTTGVPSQRRISRQWV